VTLTLTSRRDADTVTVAVGGVVDLSTADLLEREIVAAVSSDDDTAIVVDLTDVTFMDSAGISVLLKGRRLADDRAKSYRVVGAAGIVRQVLDLTGVWAHLSGHSG
jgi:anti-sigma B factor antagonist